LSWQQNGDTALHVAAAMGRKKIAITLLDAGVNVSVTNKVGESMVRKLSPFCGYNTT